MNRERIMYVSFSVVWDCAAQLKVVAISEKTARHFEH